MLRRRHDHSLRCPPALSTDRFDGFTKKHRAGTPRPRPFALLRVTAESVHVLSDLEGTAHALRWQTSEVSVRYVKTGAAEESEDGS